jgi:O-antigen ligase
MFQLLKLNQTNAKRLEILLLFGIYLYYLGFNISEQATQLWALLCFICVPLLIARCWKHYFWVLSKNLPILIALIIVPISVLWSTSPEHTLAYSRAFICSTAFGIYIAARYNPNEHMQHLAWLFGMSILLNLIMPLLVPSYGISEGFWRGINRHKNELSAAMALTATFFLTNALYINIKIKERCFAFLGVCISIFILVMTQGKGSLSIFTGLLTILPLNQLIKQKYKLRTCLIISATFIVFFLIVSVALNFEFIVVDLLNKDVGLNGRDNLWNYLIDRAIQRSWLGYGYGGFWTNPEEGKGVAVLFPWIGGVGEGGGNAHSNYMDVFLQLGWLGLITIAISIMTTLIKIILLLGISKRNEFFWMLQSTLFLAITSYYESYGGFLAYRHLFWVLYVSYSSYAGIYFYRVFLTRKKILKLI